MPDDARAMTSAGGEVSTRQGRSSAAWVVFGLAYAYAAFAALVFQKLVLPRMPALHAGHGLLRNDATYFHQTAVDIAHRIAIGGWSELGLLVSDGISGNVKLLAAVYAVFGADPVWFIPFTAGFHALGAMLLYRIGVLLWPGREGRVGGLAAAVLFTLFPSALQWYGQNHKDAFAIAGTLLLVHAWLRALPPGSRSARDRIGILLSSLTGAFLVLFVRSYLLQILFGAMLLGLAAALIASRIRRSSLRGSVQDWAWSAVPVAVLAVAAVLGPRHQTQEIVESQSYIDTVAQPEWSWRPTAGLPTSLDNGLRRLAITRAHFAGSGRSAGSIVDPDVVPSNASEVVAYVPRALSVGLFAPFPGTWVDRPTPIRLVGAAETLLWYLIAPGVLLFLRHRPDGRVVATLAFGLCVLGIIGFTQPVIGTAYRLRFAAWMLYLLVGTVGWCRVVLRLLDAAESKRQAAGPAGGFPERQATRGMTGVAADGTVVMLVWALTLVGFLVRDLMLVNANGLGGEIAAFFSAMMIPMFFFAFLSAPLADAMTGPFLRLDQGGRQRLAQVLLGHSGLLLAVIGGLLIAMAEEAVRQVMPGAGAPLVNETASLLRWSVPFLVFSGWTVIGGAVLNASGRARSVAFGQLSVPLVAVSVLVAFESSLGIRAALLGMLAGMATNTAIVALAARRAGVTLLPSLSMRGVDLRGVLSAYAPLALAALFVSASVPVNYALAGRAGSAAIPTWAFASKLVQVFTTSAGFSIGAVVLPHLAALVAHRRSKQVRDDTSFLLITGAWISTACALGVIVLAEPVALTLLAGERISSDQARDLAMVLRIGALQLPFVVCSAVVLKLAAVAGGSGRATVATGAGLLVNLAAGVLLVPAHGLGGVAIAATAGAASAAAAMLLLARRNVDLPMGTVLSLSGTWAFFAILEYGLDTGSRGAMAMSLVGLLALGCHQWALLADDPGRIAARGARTKPRVVPASVEQPLHVIPFPLGEDDR